MLPFVDVVSSNGSFANESVNTTLTPITDVFYFYGGDFSTDSGHALIIEETRKFSKLANLEPIKWAKDLKSRHSDFGAGR